MPTFASQEVFDENATAGDVSPGIKTPGVSFALSLPVFF
jgi:hypothetical protein